MVPCPYTLIYTYQLLLIMEECRACDGTGACDLCDMLGCAPPCPGCMQCNGTGFLPDHPPPVPICGAGGEKK